MTDRTPFADELLRRMRRRHPDAELDVRPGGRAVVEWQPAPEAPPVRLETTETALTRAVGALGRDSRDALWPGGGIEEAGFDLLLVHLEELLDTRDGVTTIRVTDDGVEWPG
jgi:hypothetical protein